MNKRQTNQNGQKIFVVNTFCQDEPIQEILEAAKKTPKVKYYITGNKKKASIDTIRRASSNVFFTDFIPDDEYWKLLDDCDGVICLTTRDYTLVCGGYEAIYSDKPLITSNFPVLKNYFRFGTVYVDNTVDSIVEAVKKIGDEKNVLIDEICRGKQIMKKEWQCRFREFEELFEG
jgi:hypothetical protein